jgi:hypothetical protein
VLALDYSNGRPAGAAVKAAGFDAVVRYTGFDPALRGKCVTRAEYESHLAAGVAVAFVYEDDVGTSLQGRGRGQADAHAVLQWADAIGAPVPACYFAVDFDAQPGQYAAIDDYFRGAADILGTPRVGGYGSYAVVGHLFDAGLVTYGWQTVAWSHGLREPRAHLFQRLGTAVVDGVQCDVNDVLADDFGQYPNPIKKDTGGFLVALADWEQHRLYDRVLSMSQGVANENFDGEQFQREQGWRDTISQQLAAIQGAISAEEAALLAAIKAVPAAAADPAAIAGALTAAGLPAQVSTALLAVLNKAATPTP